MYRIEKKRDGDYSGPWEQVGNARYLTRESAEKAMRRHLDEAMSYAKRSGLPRTPRFRIVEARHVMACATVQ